MGRFTGGDAMGGGAWNTCVAPAPGEAAGVGGGGADTSRGPKTCVNSPSRAVRIGGVGVGVIGRNCCVEPCGADIGD